MIIDQSITKKDVKWATGYELLGLDAPSDVLCKFAVSSGSISNNKIWVNLNRKSINKIASYCFKNGHASFGALILPAHIDDDHLLIGLDKNVIQVVATFNIHGHSYEAISLTAVKHSTFKAHQLYSAFIKSGAILTSEFQSPGGIKVWKKLARLAGISVFGWDDHDRPVNLGRVFDESETHLTREEMNERYANDRFGYDLMLVASTGAPL